jgi:hypothetical protein
MSSTVAALLGVVVGAAIGWFTIWVNERRP